MRRALVNLGDLSCQFVEKEIKGGNTAVPGDDEISPGVIWFLARPARYPLHPPAIAHFLGLGDWRIAKVRVSHPDRARKAVDLVTAAAHALAGIVEYPIFGVELFGGCAPARGVVFPENLLKIA